MSPLPQKVFLFISVLFFADPGYSRIARGIAVFFSSSPNHKRTQLFATLLILQKMNTQAEEDPLGYDYRDLASFCNARRRSSERILVLKKHRRGILIAVLGIALLASALISVFEVAKALIRKNLKRNQNKLVNFRMS